VLVLAEPANQSPIKSEHGAHMIHFIWLTQPGSRAFSFINMLAVRAAHKFYPDEIVMWTNDAPKNNPNWEWYRFQTRHVDLPDNDWPVQYKADLLRLQIMHEHGGIYLDTDSLLLRPLDPLLGPDCVLARESSDSYAMSPIIAKPGAEFIKIWLDRLPGAIGPVWASHAVNLPVELHKYHKCDVRPQEEFFPFDLRHNYLFDDGRADEHAKRMGNPYALHVYETYWAGYLEGVNETYMKTRDTLFARLFKHLV
jgi:hypothetical protein